MGMRLVVLAGRTALLAPVCIADGIDAVGEWHQCMLLHVSTYLMCQNLPGPDAYGYYCDYAQSDRRCLDVTGRTAWRPPPC